LHFLDFEESTSFYKRMAAMRKKLGRLSCPDPLHILKRLRSRLLAGKCNLSMSPGSVNEYDLYNCTWMKEAFNLPAICFDKSIAAKMSDQAALLLFEPSHIPDLITPDKR